MIDLRNKIGHLLTEFQNGQRSKEEVADKIVEYYSIQRGIEYSEGDSKKK